MNSGLTCGGIGKQLSRNYILMPITNTNLVSQYAQLHKTKRYGHTANSYMSHVRACIVDLRATRVLEYGCGQSKLGELLGAPGLEWMRYDPAISEFSALPQGPVDLVVCTDVMEHIPEEDVEDVLRHIGTLCRNVFFNIATRRAKTILPDGQNAHCTVWTVERWMEVLRKEFTDVSVVHIRPHYSCLAITWSSPCGGELVREIEDLRLAASGNRRKRGVLGRLLGR